MKKILNGIFIFSSISPFEQDNEIIMTGIKTQIEIMIGMIIETIAIIWFQIKHDILFKRIFRMRKIPNGTIAMANGMVPIKIRTTGM
jgi:hypothetical protein